MEFVRFVACVRAGSVVCASLVDKGTNPTRTYKNPRTASVRWRRSVSRAGTDGDEPGGVRGIPGCRPVDGSIMGTSTPTAQPAGVPPVVRDRGRAGLLAQAPRGVPCHPLIDRTDESGKDLLPSSCPCPDSVGSLPRQGKLQRALRVRVFRKITLTDRRSCLQPIRRQGFTAIQ
jgi:hypothetical protein